MEKQEIIKILDDWNFWQKDLNTGIFRDVYVNKIESFIETGMIVAITGARRSGKSFIMRQAAKKLMEKGVEKNRILIVNLEDPRFTGLDLKFLDEIYETYLDYQKPKEKPYIFLDEIQEVKNWEKWPLMIKELEKAYIAVSGSNAHLLSKELATLLTGRRLDVEIFPLSFAEFLNFNDLQIDKNNISYQEEKIKKMLGYYSENGGFPEIAFKENKKEFLVSYFNDLLKKDLFGRHNIRKTEKFKSLVKFYLSNITSPITFNSLGKTFEISDETIEKFSGYLEEIYLTIFLKRFSVKVKNQEKSPRKVYALDTGLSNAVGFRFSENLGILDENLVFIELLRRKNFDLNLEIYYWKDAYGKEVDFVVKNNLEIKELIQVCHNCNDEKTKKREVSALLKAMEELKINNGTIITNGKKDQENEEKIGDKIIKYKPLWKWLLKV
ncbi:MAG: ATP-binding protein [bacterium]